MIVDFWTHVCIKEICKTQLGDSKYIFFHTEYMIEYMHCKVQKDIHLFL